MINLLFSRFESSKVYKTHTKQAVQTQGNFFKQFERGSALGDWREDKAFLEALET